MQPSASVFLTAVAAGAVASSASLRNSNSPHIAIIDWGTPISPIYTAVLPTAVQSPLPNMTILHGTQAFESTYNIAGDTQTATLFYTSWDASGDGDALYAIPAAGGQPKIVWNCTYGFIVGVRFDAVWRRMFVAVQPDAMTNYPLTFISMDPFAPTPESTVVSWFMEQENPPGGAGIGGFDVHVVNMSPTAETVDFFVGLTLGAGSEGGLWLLTFRGVTPSSGMLVPHYALTHAEAGWLADVRYDSQTGLVWMADRYRYTFGSPGALGALYTVNPDGTNEVQVQLFKTAHRGYQFAETTGVLLVSDTGTLGGRAAGITTRVYAVNRADFCAVYQLTAVNTTECVLGASSLQSRNDYLWAAIF